MGTNFELYTDVLSSCSHHRVKQQKAIHGRLQGWCLGLGTMLRRRLTKTLGVLKVLMRVGALML